MEFALQFGWGMMGHSKQLVKQWGNTEVILSPRDLDEKQLERFSKEIRKLGGALLLDPQFYLPHSDHERLVAHDYWPDDYDSVVFWSGPPLQDLLRDLDRTNTAIGTSRIILPGLHATAIDADWLAQQSAILEEADGVGISPERSLATVALSDDAVRSNSQVEELLEASREWPVQGIYLICEHPRGDYLVQDPVWLANQLDLVAGWRLRGKDVLLGYASHQNLVTVAAGANAIASGTWMNVRSFPPDKFKAALEDEIKRKAIWYYAPDALSEFKIPFLDIAAAQGLLGDLAPQGTLQNGHSKNLFTVAQPSTARFSEGDAFRHYLHCLREQTITARQPTFQETCQWLAQSWNEAETRLRRLHDVRVTGQMRDFLEPLDACRAALELLVTTRGPILEREWSKL